MKRIVFGAAGALAITCVLACGHWWQASKQQDIFEQNLAMQQQEVKIPASLLTAKVQGGERQIINGDGRLKVLYFGFTQCPDVCPTSLAVLSAALQELDESQLAQIDPVFVSLDPKRDDAKLVDEYSQFFHPKMRGLSLHEGQLKGLSQMLGVYYQYVDMPESKMSYSVDHSSVFYFLDSHGNLLQRVPHTLSPEPSLASIKNHIQS